MKRFLLVPSLLAISACAGAPVEPTYIDLSAAPVVDIAPPPVVDVPDPVPLKRKGKTDKRINQRVEPGTPVDAVTLFPYEENRIYRVTAAPGYFTEIQLEPGEVMPGKAAVGDPDPARWIVEKTMAGSRAGPRVILVVKPGKPGLGTNIVLATNRRTYQIEVSSVAKRSMDIVRWSYPTPPPAPVVPVATASAFDPELFTASAYKVDLAEGDRPAWMPVNVFWTGAKTYIEFPAGIGQVSAPALFQLSASGDPMPVPFRVRGRFYEVDQQLASAELRQGKTVVKIRSGS